MSKFVASEASFAPGKVTVVLGPDSVEAIEKQVQRQVDAMKGAAPVNYKFNGSITLNFENGFISDADFGNTNFVTVELMIDKAIVTYEVKLNV